MITEALLADLRRDEGLRLRAYPDPLTGGSPWTIGYGHTGLDVHPGLVWTVDQAEAALRADVAKAERLLDAYAPWWRGLAPARQDVLLNMTFNLGWGDGQHGLSSFKRTLSKIRRGDYAGAAANMLASLWARQVGARADRLAEMMRTGARPLVTS